MMFWSCTTEYLLLYGWFQFWAKSQEMIKIQIREYDLIRSHPMYKRPWINCRIKLHSITSGKSNLVLHLPFLIEMVHCVCSPRGGQTWLVWYQYSFCCTDIILHESLENDRGCHFSALVCLSNAREVLSLRSVPLNLWNRPYDIAGKCQGIREPRAALLLSAVQWLLQNRFQSRFRWGSFDSKET